MKVHVVKRRAHSIIWWNLSTYGAEKRTKNTLLAEGNGVLVALGVGVLAFKGPASIQTPPSRSRPWQLSGSGQSRPPFQA